MTELAHISPKNDLEKEVLQLREKVRFLEEEVSQLADYLRLARQNRFGRRSEKNRDHPALPGITQVFDEAAPDKDPKKQPKSRKAWRTQALTRSPSA